MATHPVFLAGEFHGQKIHFCSMDTKNLTGLSDEHFAFTWASLAAQTVKTLPAMQETWV